MTTDPSNEEHPMSDQDPTRYITVDEQWSLLPPARPHRQKVSNHLPLHRPSDITGNLADDTAPPDREAAWLVREGLPIGAPGIDVDPGAITHRRHNQDEQS